MACYPKGSLACSLLSIKPMNHKNLMLLASMLFLQAGACSAGSSEDLEEIHQREIFIVNGQEDTGHPAVGMLRYESALCTATLIGSKVLLTAGHCVQAGTPTFLLGKTSYSVAKMIQHPNYIIKVQIGLEF